MESTVDPTLRSEVGSLPEVDSAVLKETLFNGHKANHVYNLKFSSSHVKKSKKSKINLNTMFYLIQNVISNPI